MWFLVAVVGLAGCGPAPMTVGPSGSRPGSGSLGGQSGEDPAGGCSYDAAVVGPTDALPGGTTAEDLWALAGGAFAGDLAWADAPATTFALDAAWDGEIRRIDATATGTSGSTDCPGWLELDGVVAFSTADGALAETDAAVLHGWDAGASLDLRWEEGTLAGAYAFPDDPDGASDGVSTLALSATFDDAGVAGWLSVTTRTEQTGGVVGESSAEGPVATFGP